MFDPISASSSTSFSSSSSSVVAGERNDRSFENYLNNLPLDSSKILVIVFVNNGYVDMYQNFLHYYNLATAATSTTKHTTGSFVLAVIALDSSAALRIPGSYFNESEDGRLSSSSELFGTQRYFQLLDRKPWYLLEALRIVGHSVAGVLLSDLDCLWLRSPLNFLLSPETNLPLGDIVVAEESMNNLSPSFIMFSKPVSTSSSSSSLSPAEAFASLWVRLQAVSSMKDQQLFNHIVSVTASPTASVPPFVAIRKLEPFRFVNGLHFYVNKREIDPAYIVTVHNNWLARGAVAKTLRFQSHHQWKIETVVDRVMLNDHFQQRKNAPLFLTTSALDLPSWAQCSDVARWWLGFLAIVKSCISFPRRATDDGDEKFNYDDVECAFLSSNDDDDDDGDDESGKRDVVIVTPVVGCSLCSCSELCRRQGGFSSGARREEVLMANGGGAMGGGRVMPPCYVYDVFNLPGEIPGLYAFSLSSSSSPSSTSDDEDSVLIVSGEIIKDKEAELKTKIDVVDVPVQYLEEAVMKILRKGRSGPLRFDDDDWWKKIYK